jgi:hypothetical protein
MTTDRQKVKLISQKVQSGEYRYRDRRVVSDKTIFFLFFCDLRHLRIKASNDIYEQRFHQIE